MLFGVSKKALSLYLKRDSTFCFDLHHTASLILEELLVYPKLFLLSPPNPQKVFGKVIKRCVWYDAPSISLDRNKCKLFLPAMGKKEKHTLSYLTRELVCYVFVSRSCVLGWCGFEGFPSPPHPPAHKKSLRENKSLAPQTRLQLFTPQTFSRKYHCANKAIPNTFE